MANNAFVSSTGEVEKYNLLALGPRLNVLVNVVIRVLNQVAHIVLNGVLGCGNRVSQKSGAY
jgi:hypothetical protein